MNSYGQIYMIVCKKTNKRYIGWAVNAKKRVEGQSGHFDAAIRMQSDAHPKLYRSIRKYGVENHVWSIIDWSSSLEWLKEQEKFWIKEFDTFRNGLNCTLGGDGIGGGKDYPDSIREKISKTRIERGVAKGKNNPMYGNGHYIKNRKRTKEQKLNYKWKPGRKVRSKATLETRRRMSLASKGKQKSMQHRLNISRGRLGIIPWNKGLRKT